MIKDDDFFRMDGVPLTKEEIRAISTGKLQLKPDDVVVDIGCGSGGMTVEIARRCKFVYAIDVSDDAILTTKKNLDKFNIKNCKVIKGNAEEILPDLEFNKAFIGGTKNINKILSILKEKVFILKKVKEKYQFSIKNKDELANLTHEELLEYTKTLTDDWHKNKKKPKKDSSNSSLPTSKDIAPPKNKRNQSLRESSGKSSGGQKGHKGSNLKQSDNI